MNWMLYSQQRNLKRRRKEQKNSKQKWSDSIKLFRSFMKLFPFGSNIMLLGWYRPGYLYDCHNAGHLRCCLCEGNAPTIAGQQQSNGMSRYEFIFTEPKRPLIWPQHFTWPGYSILQRTCLSSEPPKSCVTILRSDNWHLVSTPPP